MFTIKFKIILAYTLAFGVLLTIFAAIIYNSTREAAFMKLDTNLKSYSISLRTEIEDELDDHEQLDLKKLSAIRAKGLIEEKFQLFNSKGEVVTKDSTFYNIPTDDIKKAVKNTFIYEKKRVKHRKYHILWSSFETAKDSVYILETAASDRDVHEELDRMFYLFLFIIPAGLIITGITAYFISKAAFKPVARMADTAKNISGKNLDMRLELPKARDEVRALGETLNEMIERIDYAFKSQKRFVANASHEIRTPLTVIQTELEILDKKIKDTELNESIKNALSEIESLSKLTSSLLTIAKLDISQDKLNLSQIRIDELLADCVQTMNQAAVKKNIQITLSLDDAVEMKADKEKLKSVFLNLIDNAIKYSMSGSGVTIVLGKITGNKININVEDSGIGISPSEIPYIFNRFYRSNEIRAEISGSGLGLAIAKEIVDLHRGEIKVKSEIGVKTVFNITLPTNLS
ncbi:MAG: HAMP domain-containing sensor histidine kinase [Ignavibacteriaceae bacterium]|nr:HAMP domain-containing sensor histidine kinase [Ignavibacteriaceae bacterium]